MNFENFRRNVRQNSGRWMMGVTFLLAIVLTLLLYSDDLSELSEIPTFTKAGVEFEDYVVRRGDFLWKIADAHDVPRLTLLTINEGHLRNLYEDRCTLLRERYRKRRTGGHYCNEKYSEYVHANSLKPGDVVRIPHFAPSTEIAQAIIDVPGQKLSVVIDATGSMNNDIDRKEVAIAYQQAIENAGREVISVWFYAFDDMENRPIIWTIKPDGSTDLFAGVRSQGSFEAVYRALRKAYERDNPDAIVLIGDEAGDDLAGHWGQMAKLPPVLAHCIKDQNVPRSCTKTFKRIASETGGTFRTSGI
tara:strand:+ start:3066 stop:3977 length:912 start_codon:yes stop_codon:yes gene_type:complete